MVGVLKAFLLHLFGKIVNLIGIRSRKDVGKCMTPIQLNVKKFSVFDDYRFKFNFVNNELQRLYLKILQLKKHALVLKDQLFLLRKGGHIVSLPEYKNIKRELSNTEVLLGICLTDKTQYEIDHERIKQIVERKPCAVINLKKNTSSKRKNSRKGK